MILFLKLRRKYPLLLFFLFPYIVGILISGYLLRDAEFKEFYQFLLPLVAISFILLLLVFQRPSFSKRHIPGILVWGGWVVLGMVSYKAQQPEMGEEPELMNGTNERLWMGKVLQCKGGKDGIRSYVIALEGYYQKGSGVKVDRAKCRITVKKGEELFPGDRILCRTAFRSFNTPTDPAAFDRKDYYHSKGIFFQSFVDGEDVQRIGERTSDPLLWMRRVREKIFARLRQDLEWTDEQLGLAGALLLGKKSAIPDGLRDSYSRAGAMHVLAVSGLHVGIVYLMLSYFTFPLKWSRKGNALRMVIILVALWGFALLAGASPSVTRAVLMFSLFALGNGLGREPLIYNMIAGSAFLILLIAPSMLFNIGFLLSYCAVVAIIHLFPLFDGLVYSRYKAIGWIRATVAVSLAAQIGTAPIISRVFGQLPSYFLLTNIIVLPLVSLILYVGAILLSVSWSDSLFLWVGKGLGFLLDIMNRAVTWVASLPGSSWEPPYLSLLSTFLLGGVFVCFAIHWSDGHRKWFFAGWLFLTLLLGSLAYDKWSVSTKKRFVVHDIGKAPYVSILCGTKGITLGKKEKWDNNAYVRDRVCSFHRTSGVADHKFLPFSKDPGRVQSSMPGFFWDGRTLLTPFIDVLILQNDKLPKASIKGRIRIDLVILMRDPPSDPTPFLEVYDIGGVIVAEDFPPWKIRKWKEQFRGRIHDMEREGAFDLDL